MKHKKNIIKWWREVEKESKYFLTGVIVICIISVFVERHFDDKKRVECAEKCLLEFEIDEDMVHTLSKDDMEMLDECYYFCVSGSLPGEYDDRDVYF